MATSEELKHLKKIALPSSIGINYGERIFGHPWVLYPWISYMERRVIDAIADDTHERYIIINAPPQTGKSSWCGMLLPFWVTGMFPDKNLMYISYSDEFSTARGKDVRALHNVYGQELFGSSIDPDFQTATDWRIAGHRGGMLSVGIGGLITGKPGHVIIIDDLIKNAQEAASVATKKLHLAEWDGTINRRMQPGGTVIIIATRWAEDDLSGALQARMAEPGYDGPQWEVLEFPAFAMPPDDYEPPVRDVDPGTTGRPAGADDPSLLGERPDGELPAHDNVELTPVEQEQWRDILGRIEGEVLDCRFSRIPGRDPADFFTKARSSMDVFTWSCLYQQRPSSREGGMFPREKWKFYKPDDVNVDDMDKAVRVWDIAATDGGGDWTVGCLVGKKGRQFYVLDVRRFRLNSGGVYDEVERVAKIDGFGVKVMFEEEKGGSGKTVTESMRRLLIGHVVEPAKAEGDKESRATPYSAEVHKGNFYLPEKGSTDWDVQAFITEHAGMMGDGRKPKHDDQIDTAAYATMELLGHGATEMFIPGVDMANISLERQMAMLDGGLEALFAG